MSFTKDYVLMQTSALRPQASYWAANEIAPVTRLLPWTFPRSQLIWEDWHLVTLLLHHCGFLPLRSPIWAVTKCNLCFSCVILWDQCLRQRVWQEISGWRKKARCDVDCFTIWNCHFYLNLWVNVLFSPTTKFKISVFALQDIPLEPQIRWKIDTLIISSSPDNRWDVSGIEYVTFCGPLTFKKIGPSFPINEVLSERASGFEESKAIYTPSLSRDQPKIHIYSAIHSEVVRCVGSSYTEVFLDCFLKNPPAWGKTNIRDT